MSTPPPLTPEQLDAYTGDSLIIVTAVSLVVCVLLVSLRFFCRLYLRDAPVGWDDYLMVPAILFQIGMCILSIVHVKYGMVGYHIQRVTETFGGGERGMLIAIERWGKVLFAIYFFWDWATVFPRLSVIALYLRIFSGKSIRVCCWALITFIVAYGIAFQLAAIFACSPVQFAWNRNIEGGKCFNIQLFFQLSTLPLIISDIPLLLLPIPQVWKLEMTRARKVGVILTFLTGGFGLVASCLRFAFFFSSTVLTDPTWDSSRIILWTTVEPALYNVAACLVAMRPFMAMLFPEKVRSYARTIINQRSGDRILSVRSKRAYARDPALELGTFSKKRWRGDGFGPLGDTGSMGPAHAAGGAFVDRSSLDDQIENMAWPSREFEDAIHVKKEVWVSRSPFPA